MSTEQGSGLDPQADGMLTDILSDTPAAPAAPVASPVETPAAPVAPPAPVVEDPVVEAHPTMPEDVLKRTPTLAPDQPPPPPPPPAVDPDLADAPPEARQDPRAMKSWTSIKRELKEAQSRLQAELQARKDLETKLAQAPDPAQANEVEQMRAQLAEYEEKLGRLDLTQSRAFQQQYVVPDRQIFQRGVGLLTRAGKTPEEAQHIMVSTLQTNGNLDQIQEIVGQEAPAIQGALVQLAMDHAELDARRSEAVKQWKDTHAQMQEENARMINTEIEKVRGQSVQAAVETLRGEGSWLFLESDVDDKWNQAVGTRVRAVQGVLRSGDPVQIAKYVADGVAARTYRELYEHEHKARLALDKELKTRVGVRPRIGGGVSQESPAPVQEPILGPSEWLDANLGGTPNVAQM